MIIVERLQAGERLVLDGGAGGLLMAAGRRWPRVGMTPAAPPW